MATTTIPWGDGSGDNIYLTYSSASGDQTVDVTSDANTGAARSKVVTFNSGVGGIVQMLTVTQDAGGPVYVSEDVASYDSTDYAWYAVSNISRAYAGYTSTDYAQINATRGSGAETHVYFEFDTPTIPSDAYVYYVECRINGYITNTTNLSGTFTLCNGTTELGYSVAIGGSSAANKTFFIRSGELTSSQIQNLRIKATLTRGTSSTNSNYYLRFYGATLSFVYEDVHEDYITFADQNVASICATTWGDGIGITPIQAKRVPAINTEFRGNTNITSFDELGEYFTGVTSIYGTSSSPYGAFAGCTALTSITLPDSTASIGHSAFRGCSALQHLGVPHKSITLDQYSFYGCTSLVDLYCPGAQQNYTLYNTGNGTGTLYVRGDARTSNGYTKCSFKHIIISGGVSQNTGGGRWFTNTDSYTETLRVYGNCNMVSGSYILRTNSSGSATRPLKFGELLGTAGSSAGEFCREACFHSDFIMHLGYTSGVACLPAFIHADSTYVTKIYVGDGSSQAADQAILDMYLADTDWAAYSSKLDLWYNYNGDYKNPPTIPTV